MNLADLIRQLIAEEGLTPEEAARVAAASVRAQRTSIERAGQQGGRVSIQEDRRGVEYGEETPEEAERRWKQQEREDPNGFYSLGGSTTGGIFGDHSIALDDHDPGAVQRNLDGQVKLQQARVQAQQLEVQNETLRLLHELAGERLPPSRQQLEPPIDTQRGPFRRLGKKRR